MGITEFLAEYITQFIEWGGYPIVVLLMTMESMIFPVPSEAVMPFAGFLIAENKMDWVLVIVTSTLGSIIGSSLSYMIGFYGGKPFIKHFGKWFLLNEHDLELTERFFARFGQIAILISRFVPIVRHLISIPAGAGKMKFLPFIVMTTIGAACWNAILTYAGFFLRQNWGEFLKYVRIVDIVILVLLIALVIWFVVSHLARLRKEKSQNIPG